MKTQIAVLALGLLMGGAAVARQVIPNSESSSARSNELWDLPVVAEDSSVEDAVVVSKADAATRPLKVEKSDDQAARRIEPGSRAWTTLVGWHPGASAFADPMTHESKLMLFTLRGSRQQ